MDILLPFFTLPFPLHSGHLPFIILPSPPHSEHAVILMICPNMVLLTSFTCPIPSHLEHVSIFPFSPIRVPLQPGHFTIASISMVRETLFTASLISMDMSDRMSPPSVPLRLCCRPPPLPLEKMDENGSSSNPENPPNPLPRPKSSKTRRNTPMASPMSICISKSKGESSTVP